MTHELTTPRLVLTVINDRDRDDVFMTMNYQNTAQTISFMAWPMTMRQAEDWCEKSEKGFLQKTDFMFIARDKDSNNTIGCIGIHEANSHGGDVGYWICEEEQGKGYASEMLKAIVWYAFEDIKLAGLFATAIPANLKSQAVLKKNGFELIGETRVIVAEGKIADRYVFRLQRK